MRKFNSIMKNLLTRIEELEKKARELESTKQFPQSAKSYINAGILSEKLGLDDRAKINYYHASEHMTRLAKDVYGGAFQ